VHRTAWPTTEETEVQSDEAIPPALLTHLSVALSQVRGAKSTAQVSMKTEIAHAVVRGPAEILDQIRPASDDLAAAGRIAEISFEPAAGEIEVDVRM
jgi:valyl-tRNA synthetase